MLRFILMLFICFFFRCSQHEGTGLLSHAPYEKLTDSIQRQPSVAALYYRRGSLLYQNNEKALAEADLKKAWQLQPTEQHALSVVTVLIDRDRNAAIRFMEQALQQLPESVSLRITLARGYQQKGDFQKVIAICDQLLQTHPNALDAWLLKAEVYKQRNDRSAALSALESAYGFAPFDVELAYQLAFEYAEAKHSRALALADSLIRMDTSESHAEPYYLKGVYYRNTGNHTQALHFFNEAVRHDYNFLDAHMEKGTLLYEQKKYADALTTFRLALSITPSYADAWLWSGKCNEALNNRQEAKLDYQRAYGLDKTLGEAKEAADRL